MKPYRFFKETGDINAPTICNAQQQSLVQERIAQVNVEGDGDETLEFVATVLTRVHTTFYAHYDKNMSDRVQVSDVFTIFSRSRIAETPLPRGWFICIFYYVCFIFNPPAAFH